MIHVRCQIIEKHPGLFRAFHLFTSPILMACYIAIYSLPTQGQIQGSAHDFTSYDWSGGEFCDICHVPHSQEIPSGSAPLWNHEVSSVRYAVYESRTLSQTSEQLGHQNISRLCLSCHDGTIALDSFGGSQGENYIPKNLSLGTDLRDDHPIGVRPTRRGSGNSATHENGVKFYDGKVECPSCHDVHNNQVSDEKLLRVARMGSELCFQCHDK